MADESKTTEAMETESVDAAHEGSEADVQKEVSDAVASELDLEDGQKTASIAAEDDDVAADELSGPQITIVVKTPKDKKSVKVEPTANVLKLREGASREFGVSVDRLCFIYAGKILQDEDFLAANGIENDSTVHLVIKSGQSQFESRTATAEDQPNTASDASNANVYGPLQFSTVGLDSLNYSQLQQHMQRQLLSNPELIRQMVQNPLVQQLMANPAVITDLISSNPQTKSWLQKNPELAEMLKNPEVMQQTLEISQNPEMLNELIAAQGRGRVQFGGGAAAASGSQLRFGAAASMPELQTVWQQLAENPQLLQQMLNMPYMKALLEGLAANPQLAQQMVAGHPMFAGNPVLQQQMQTMMPQYVAQMQNPAMQALVTNPKTLQAVLKIQQGLDMLHTEAPGLINSVGLPYLSVPPPLATFAPPSAAGPAGDVGVSASDSVSSIMAQMIGQMASGQISEPPDVRFKEQLDELSAMGFTDYQANLSVLIGSFGDLSAAVERLNQQQSS